jgi:hypothetical protein
MGPNHAQPCCKRGYKKDCNQGEEEVEEYQTPIYASKVTYTVQYEEVNDEDIGNDGYSTCRIVLLVARSTLSRVTDSGACIISGLVIVSNSTMICQPFSQWHCIS